MLRYSKVLLILFLLTGCTKEYKPVELISPPHQQVIAFNDPLHDPIFSPVKQPPLFINPIDCNEIELSNGHTIEIDGLLNQTIQQTINDKIHDKTEQIQKYHANNLPPYRGIAQEVVDDAQLVSDTLYTQCQYNANHVLSLSFSRNMVFVSQSKEVLVSVEDGLTVDVRTGKDLSLSDVVTNDVDAQQFFNERVPSELDKAKQRYYFGDSIIELVQPFSGLKNNQKFFISSQGVELILDYSSSDFYLGFSNFRLTFDFALFHDVLALPYRFLSKENIFEQPISQGMLLNQQSEPMRMQTTLEKIAGVSVQFSRPQKESFEVDKRFTNQLIMKAQSIFEEEDDVLDAHITIFAHKLLDYTSYSASISFYDRESIHHHYSLCSVYKNNEQVLLDDIITSSDFRQVMETYILENLKYYVGYPITSLSEIEPLKGFNISPFGIELDIKLRYDDLHFSMVVPYDVIGLENIVFFKELLELVS